MNTFLGHISYKLLNFLTFSNRNFSYHKNYYFLYAYKCKQANALNMPVVHVYYEHSCVVMFIYLKILHLRKSSSHYPNTCLQVVPNPKSFEKMP